MQERFKKKNNKKTKGTIAGVKMDTSMRNLNDDKDLVEMIHHKLDKREQLGNLSL